MSATNATSTAQSRRTLVLWLAPRHGFDGIRRTITQLEASGRKLDQVLVLVQQSQSLPLELLEQLPMPAERITLALENPTRHDEILGLLRREVLPRLEGAGALDINTSSGTPAMHAAWLLLSVTGALPRGTRLWSTSWNRDTDEVVLEPVRLDMETTVARWNEASRGSGDRAFYDLDARSQRRKAFLDRFLRAAQLPNVAPLLLGEPGTGKSRLATAGLPILRELGGPVFTIDCAFLDHDALPRLLGVDRDSDPDRNGRPGLLERARHGLVVFEHVERLKPELQRVIATLIEERSLRRLGGIASRPLETDLAFTSCSDPGELVEILTPDLAALVLRVVVDVPPLRSCQADLPADWERVWLELAPPEEREAGPPWSEELADVLATHPLKGNFRDLQRLACEILLDSRDGESVISPALLDRWRTDGARAATDDDGPYGPGSWDEREQRFKSHLAEWAVATHRTQIEAARFLSTTDRTLRKYLAPRSAAR